MAEEVSFLDVASGRGVVNIAQQGADAIGTIASGLAKQKGKEDKAAKAQLNEIAKMVTPPSKMHKLVKEPAAKNYVATIQSIYNSYNSGDPNFQTNAMSKFGEYTEDMAAKSALSDNLNAFDKIRRDKTNYIPKNYRALGGMIDKANNAQQFTALYEKNPVAGINMDNLNIEDIPIKKKIPIQTYQNTVFNGIEPIELGKQKETVIVQTEKEAKAAFTKHGVKPNSIESVVVNRFLDDFEFLEQYIDEKNFDMDYTNLGPEDLGVLKEELIKDGAQFVLKKFPKDPMKFSFDMGKDAVDTPFGFSKGVSLAPRTINKEGANVVIQTAQFGVVKPNQQPPTSITTYKGTLDRTGKQVQSDKAVEAVLSGVVVMPYQQLEGGEERGVFDVSEIATATGFKVYYEFGGGDYYVPVSQMRNLQFNVGQKDPVAAQKFYLEQLTTYRTQLNDYQKKVKRGAIKDALLYKKLIERKKGLIDDDELLTFVNNFKFDK